MPIIKNVKSRRVCKKVKIRRVCKKVKSRIVRKSKKIKNKKVKVGKSYSPPDQYTTTQTKEYRIVYYYNDILGLQRIINLGIPIVMGGFYSIPEGVEVKLINQNNPFHPNIWVAKILSVPPGEYDFYKYPNDTYISSFNVDDF